MRMNLYLKNNSEWFNYDWDLYKDSKRTSFPDRVYMAERIARIIDNYDQLLCDKENYLIKFVFRTMIQ